MKKNTGQVRKRFRLTVEESPPQAGEPTPERRLAALLKLLLRRFRFVCVRVEEIPADPEADRDP